MRGTEYCVHSGADELFMGHINPGNRFTRAPLLFEIVPGPPSSRIKLRDSVLVGE